MSRVIGCRARLAAEEAVGGDTSDSSMFEGRRECVAVYDGILERTWDERRRSSSSLWAASSASRTWRCRSDSVFDSSRVSSSDLMRAVRVCSVVLLVSMSFRLVCRSSETRSSSSSSLRDFVDRSLALLRSSVSRLTASSRSSSIVVILPFIDASIVRQFSAAREYCVCKVSICRSNLAWASPAVSVEASSTL